MDPRAPKNPTPNAPKEKPRTAPQPAKEGLTAGDLVDSKYQIIESIGVGGFGRVYKALHLNVSQIVALKAFHSGELSASALRRIGVEARAAGNLDHKNLVRSRDFGVMSDNRPYIVMDYFEGRTLDRYVYDNGKLPYEQALDIFIQLCSGLAYAHNLGVVHRDIKPSNVLMAIDRGQQYGVSPKILDFGMAKVQVEMETQALTLTQKGELLGTPSYMSPEQCNGEATDSRSDIYSMGCTMFEALTGAPPFVAHTALEIMMKHNTTALPSLKEASLGEEFPESIEYVLKKMTAKAPADRYQYFEKVVDDLKAIQRGDFQVKKAQNEDSNARLKADTKPTGWILGMLASFIVGGASGAAYVYKTIQGNPTNAAGPTTYTVVPDMPQNVEEGALAKTLVPRRDVWVRSSALKEEPPEKPFSGRSYILVTNTFPVADAYVKSGPPDAVVFEHRETPTASFTDDNSFLRLDQVKNTKIFCIRRTVLNPAHFEYLNSFPNIRWLQLTNFYSSPKAPYQVEWLAQLNMYDQLLVLELDNMKIIKPIVDKLQTNHELRRLSLGLTTIDTAVPQADVDELLKHKTIEVLVLKNFVGVGAMVKDGVLRLNGLGEMHRLRHLFLEEETAAANLAELQKLKSLKTLYIRPTSSATTNIENIRKNLPKVEIVLDATGMETERFFDPEAQEPSGLGLFGND